MKIPNKRESQQIIFNLSLVINFEDFMNIYKKCTAKFFHRIILHFSRKMFSKEYKS